MASVPAASIRKRDHSPTLPVERKRGRYKQWVHDSSKIIPRTTNWRQRKAAGIVKSKHRKPRPAAAKTQVPAPPSSVSREDAMMSILSFANGTSQKGMERMLDVLQILTPDADLNYLRSVYKFNEEKKKCFNFKNVVTHTHHVCPACYRLFEDEERVCPPPCGHARFRVGRQPHAVYVRLDGEQQIADFYTDPSFVDALKYKSTLPRDGSMHDVYNGKLYERHAAFFEASKHHISVTWHTDGVQVQKSNINQLWPIQAVINELPPSQRFSKRNLLLFGLYYGPGKPDMNSFMTPFVHTMNKMYQEGFDVYPGGQATPVKCHVLCLGCTMDIPAMCAVKYVQLYNGEFGCGTCEYKGLTTKRGRGHAKTYPYTSKRGWAPIRTKKSMHGHAKLAIKTKKPVRGIKGYSVISLLKGVDISEHFLIDYMHGACSGLMKRLIGCWIDPTNKKQPYYIGQYLDIINARISRISPPSAMRRYPKPLTGYKLCYKASEYRDLLLFYILPVLKGILPPRYFAHLALLVRGMYILCQDDIPPHELQEADAKLTCFYKGLSTHYGIGQCTINAHNMGSHLVECVRLFGPLFAFSCFYFEDMCGQLQRMVRGPMHVVKQIVNGVNRLHELRQAEKAYSYKEGTMQLLRRDKRKLKKLDSGFKTASKLSPFRPTGNLAQQIRSYMPTCKTINRFGRAERHGDRFVAQTQKIFRHSDCFVAYSDGDDAFGVIHHFIEMVDNAVSRFAAVVAPFCCEEDNFGIHMQPDVEEDTCSHISAVRSQSSLFRIIPLNSLKKKLIFIPEQRDRSIGYVIPLPAPYLHN